MKERIQLAQLSKAFSYHRWLAAFRNCHCQTLTLLGEARIDFAAEPFRPVTMLKLTKMATKTSSPQKKEEMWQRTNCWDWSHTCRSNWAHLPCQPIINQQNYHSFIEEIIYKTVWPCRIMALLLFYIYICLQIFLSLCPLWCRCNNESFIEDIGTTDRPLNDKLHPFM